MAVHKTKIKAAEFNRKYTEWDIDIDYPGLVVLKEASQAH